MGTKGCWTCRERKIRCDSQRPNCGNCTKAQRVCKGYGVQLSWPRNDDRRRAQMARPRYNRQCPQAPVKTFLKTDAWDIILSDELRKGFIPGHHRRTMKIPSPMYLPPLTISREDTHLIDFVRESRSLVLGPTDEDSLMQFIMAVAFSSPNDPINPVLQALLAVASLQLNGAATSFRYKCLVLSSVQKLEDSPDERQLLQNLIALMLLYHYEMNLDSNSKGSWVAFFCAVKRIINTSPLFHQLVQQEYSTFLDWIFYHEVLAEFTVRHWAVPYVGCGFAPVARSAQSLENNGISIGCPVDVLQLITNSCRQAIVNVPHERERVASPDSIQDLEEKVSQALGEFGLIEIPGLVTKDRKTMVSDLHRLASLIYTNHAVHRVSFSDFRHRRLVRAGISLLGRLVTCQNGWPLFIIGCEAETDMERIAILEVFEQTRQDLRRRSNHVHFIQYIVEAVWTQKDLDADDEISYISILDAVIGGVSFMPLFA